jgi:hypothetical protein
MICVIDGQRHDPPALYLSKEPLPKGWWGGPHNLYAGGPFPPEPKPDSSVKAAESLQTTDAEVPKSNT